MAAKQTEVSLPNGAGRVSAELESQNSRDPNSPQRN